MACRKIAFISSKAVSRWVVIFWQIVLFTQEFKVFSRSFKLAVGRWCKQVSNHRCICWYLIAAPMFPFSVTRRRRPRTRTSVHVTRPSKLVSHESPVVPWKWTECQVTMVLECTWSPCYDASYTMSNQKHSPGQEMLFQTKSYLKLWIHSNCIFEVVWP